LALTCSYFLGLEALVLMPLVAGSISQRFGVETSGYSSASLLVCSMYCCTTVHWTGQAWVAREFYRQSG
jgi:hypothetical protein